MKSYLDIVICGPDHSGTSTQINDSIEFFKNKNLVVKDLRGGEFNALFHRQSEFIYDKLKFCCSEDEVKKSIVNYDSFVKFANEKKVTNLIREVDEKIIKDLRSNKPSSMVDNGICNFINPDYADVWVMEEPSKRGVGFAIRNLLMYASSFNQYYDKKEEAYAYSLDRKVEFDLYRKVLRDEGKIILRSRSEESLLYQLHDREIIRDGYLLSEAISLPGNKNAFMNGPDHLLVVAGKDGWTLSDAEKLALRGTNKVLDDFEQDIPRQALVGRRYASSDLEDMYAQANIFFGSKIPSFHRFDIWKSKGEIRDEMNSVLEKILVGRL